MNSWFNENGPTLITFVGGFIGATGALWAEFRANVESRTKRNIIPALLIFLGAMIAIGGVAWDSVQRNQSQNALASKTNEVAEGNKSLAKKSDELSTLNKVIAEKSDEIALLNREIAASVTGGNEFCYLQPQIDDVYNRLFVLVKHNGKYPIYDVAFRVLDFAKSSTKPYSEEALTTPNQVGNMAPQQLRFLEYWQLPNRPFQAYNVFFTARNNSGFVIQSLRYAKVNGAWKSATKVQPLGKEVILFQAVDPEFPVGKDGKVDWNDPAYMP